jgi:hypothetical protein
MKRERRRQAGVCCQMIQYATDETELRKAAEGQLIIVTPETLEKSSAE